MTALDQFTRLEAAGIWRESPDSKRRDVIVSFGDATLILSDPRSEVPLAHWSLPAVARLNGHRMPALYAPGADADSGEESLEIEDPLMVEAIARVHHAIAARRPHPGRLRFTLMILALIVMTAAAVFWLPDALVRYGARIAPNATKQQIGLAIIRDMEARTGPICSRPGAQRALNELATYIAGTETRLKVVPADLPRAILLPGDMMVIGKNLIENQKDAQPLAGYLVAAITQQTGHTATEAALRHGGLRATLSVLTMGNTDIDAFDGYGRKLLDQPLDMPEEEILLDAFTRLSLASTPFAYAVDDSGETVLGLIEADPMRHTAPHSLFTDKAWHTIQQICRDADHTE